MKYVLLILLAGCQHTNPYAGPIGPVPTIEGIKLTTGLGITIYAPEGWDGPRLAADVDFVTEYWILYWMGSGEGWQREVLVSRAKRIPVVFYDEVEVANRAGFYKHDSHSGVALRGEFYDPYFKRRWKGVWIWFHEATHGLKDGAAGSYHGPD